MNFLTSLLPRTATVRSAGSLSCLLWALSLLAGRGAFALNTALDVDQYAHTAWRAREGFTNGRINSIARTADGYLWLGTEFGLLRFDGVRNVPFESLTRESLPDNYIRSLLGARDGTLWIGSLRGGLASWKSGKLISYPQLAGQTVNTLLEDRAGTVWVGTESPAPRAAPAALCAIRNDDVRCEGDDGRFGQFAASLHQDTQGRLWAVTSTGLWQWRPGTPAWKSLPTPVYPSLQSLADGGDGAVLIITRGGVTRLVDGEVASPIAARPGSQPYALLRDRDGGVWIGTNGGVLHMHDGRTDAFGRPDGLSGERVEFFFEDREGSIWVATESGLDRFRDVAAPTSSVTQWLSNSLVGAVMDSRDGSIWISTRDGLNRWRNGEATVYRGRRDGGRQEALRAHPPKQSVVREMAVSGLPSGNLSLFEDDRGRIWIGSTDSIGYLENDRYVAIAPGGVVDAITEDMTGRLWIAERGRGLLSVSQDSSIQEIPWSRLGTQGPASRLAAYPQRDGLWLGFWGGGIAQFADGEIRESYSAREGLARGRVNFLRADEHGTLWVGAEGGLSRVKNGRIATLDVSSGLPCDFVDWMINDDNGAVWVYTACGIARIARSELEGWGAAVDQGRDPKRKFRFAVLDSSDGVRSHKFASSYTPHMAKSPDGRLWFVTVEGVGVVDPRHLPHNALPPPVHVEEIIADRKLYSAAASTAPLHLPPLVRDLQVDYTALSLAAPEKMLFRYKLEGRDRDWQEAGNRRQAFYGDLAPGNYRFRVIASNNSGVWNEQGDVLAFSIAPAYWQTNWFRALCAAAFLGSLWLLYVMRLRQVRHAFNMALETRVDERTRIARDLHDSLLQGFQGLMFRLQAVRQLLPERPGDAANVLDSAMQLGDRAIGEGRDAVQNLRSSSLDECDLATSLSALGTELETGIDAVSKPQYRVVVEGSPREMTTVVRDDAYRIAREAVRNAYSHAKAGQIETEITFGDADLIIRVRDDGIGVDPQILARGERAGHFGLPGMRERSESLGGQLRVWSEGNAGTEVELRIPAKIAYAQAPVPKSSWIGRLFYAAGRSLTNAGRQRGAD